MEISFHLTITMGEGVDKGWAYNLFKGSLHLSFVQPHSLQYEAAKVMQTDCESSQFTSVMICLQGTLGCIAS